MSSRRITTAVTLVVLCCILGLGLVVGLDKLFQPVDRDSGASGPQGAASCTTLRPGDRLRSRQVVLNVLNAGTRAGLAGQTLESLTARGFLAGEVDNAPSNRVRRAQVWIVDGEEAAGRLVARNLGPRTPVVKREDVVAGGVDVVVADGFQDLARPQRVLVVTRRLEVCLPEAS